MPYIGRMANKRNVNGLAHPSVRSVVTIVVVVVVVVLQAVWDVFMAFFIVFSVVEVTFRLGFDAQAEGR